MKKHVFFLIFVLFIIISGCLTNIDWSNDEGEILEGTGMGFRGPINVRLRVKNGDITEIEVDSMEDRFVGGAAIEELIDLVIENNNTDVDAITGATETSKGFLSAVENAIISFRK